MDRVEFRAVVKGPRPLPGAVEAGHRLRTLRTERSLSGRELGRRAGVDQSVIVRVEQGRLRPGPELLVRLLDALDAPADERGPIVWGMALDPAYAHLVSTTPLPGSAEGD